MELLWGQVPTQCFRPCPLRNATFPRLARYTPGLPSGPSEAPCPEKTESTTAAAFLSRRRQEGTRGCRLPAWESCELVREETQGMRIDLVLVLAARLEKF